ncbi:winged helix-turn-helix domain-containing protein [Amycolatopsis magusensis]|uniref:DNA-binding transcriptional ArsR family regulator n=1 Tax=Amycolatopsis magusensis TaxID=882444 RepID=A0ABS4PU35_9PSEU|nr:helix-turn-helix domain-containing protein [Amycolatopsis magusensis]MBP2182096.1 DNA-binding transcriptional ArsR family regulator [Amycolatopsis magusensis]
MSGGINYLEDPDRVLTALPPLRRQLLALLREPASATQLAARLDLPRQRVNYHLRALETAGLIEVVELRQRRGCVERILRVKPGALVVDPAVMREGDTDPAASHDQYAAEHLVEVAAATVRDVARMQGKAAESGKKLLTFTIEADVRFARPAAAREFTDELTEAITELVARYEDADGRPYRIVVGGHPRPVKGDQP